MEQRKIWNYFQDDGADSFTAATPKLKYLLKESISFLRNKSIKDLKVLNIGIGNGWLEKQCKELGMKVYAVDPSEVAINKLKLAGINAVVGSIVKMPFDNDYFDIVFCADVFEHLESNELFLGVKEISRSLSKGGILVGTVPFNENLFDNETVCPSCGEVFHRWGHQQSFDKKKLSQIISADGLNIEKIKLRSYPDFSRHSFKDKIKSSIRWLLGLFGANITSPRIFFMAKKC